MGTAGNFPLGAFAVTETPFYYYDTALLHATIEAVRREAGRHEGFRVHYAVKANSNAPVLAAVAAAGLGADCVSGAEVEAAIAAGIPAGKVLFAGVGKTDREIGIGLRHGIACFNVESLPELEVINGLALECGRVARVALRVNPDVDAHTHSGITTGLAENKFGISMGEMPRAVRAAMDMRGVRLIGLHFHIGSQVLDVERFRPLCDRVNRIQDGLERDGVRLESINVGGGLGIDYQDPDSAPIPDFGAYFGLYAESLRLRQGQTLHFELGRSVVGQCGTLVSRVLYVKRGEERTFAIIDAGLNDLVRPALYGAHHRIESLTGGGPTGRYDVVGPICESSDVFGRGVELPGCRRGDIIAIRSAGAYGQTMASMYNMRSLAPAYMTEDMEAREEARTNP